MGGRLHTVQKGDLLLIPPGTPHTYGTHVSAPWTIYWIHAAGAHVSEYVRELRLSAASPCAWIGEDVDMSLFFNEVFRALDQGRSFVHLLNASNALAHLLALAIRYQRERRRDNADALQRIGQCIRYMSEHLDEPLRMTRMAALANLSPAHFTVLFKQQMGCSPRD